MSRLVWINENPSVLFSNLFTGNGPTEYGVENVEHIMNREYPSGIPR